MNNMAQRPEVEGFFDEATSTVTFVVKDPDSMACAVVDSVLDFDYSSGRIAFDHADAIIAYVRDKGWQVEWLIETHAHADHLSAAGCGAGVRSADAHRR